VDSGGRHYELDVATLTDALIEQRAIMLPTARAFDRTTVEAMARDLAERYTRLIEDDRAEPSLPRTAR
jgi:hypothetical protein